MNESVLNSIHNLQAAFKYFDADEDGKITINDIKQLPFDEKVSPQIFFKHFMMQFFENGQRVGETGFERNRAN